MNQIAIQQVAFVTGASRGIAAATANVGGEEPSERLVVSVGKRRQTRQHEAGLHEAGALTENA